MAHEFNCPHCGCRLHVTKDAVRVPEWDTTEALRREIEHLQATIARLRGAGFRPRLLAPRPDQSSTMDTGRAG